MKRVLSYCFFLLLSLPLFAKEVSFTASAPDAVVNGEPFQLVYTLNQSGKDLRIPAIDGFEVIAGPFTSQNYSAQNINGRTSSTTTIRYTYTLLPQKEGSFTIQPATITVDKKKYQSNAVVIKVLPADKNSGGASANQGQGRAQQQVPLSQSITNDNLFIRPILSRTRLMEQEYILLTYKIYSRVDLIDIQTPKFPDFQGFLVQEINLPQNKQFALENYEGKNYNTIVLKQYLLYPQRSGTLDIDKMTCDAVVRVRTASQSRSIFDDFFDTYQEVKKPLSTVGSKISVSPLPKPQPANFSGGVGSFNISSSISKTSVKANESLTIKITISGNGNMKMLKVPDLNFPADFESYEPKVANNFSNTVSGVTGTKVIEYLVIPRSSGSFTIPGIEFSYYDLGSKQYKTLNTNSYNVRVAKGALNSEPANVSNYSDQERVKMLANDIRYIETKVSSYLPEQKWFYGTFGFILCYILPLLVTAFVIFFFRKQAQANADLALVRNRKANKVARKRLKQASIYLQQSNKTLFYDELLKAIWGYLCDKLTIPLVKLNKDLVVEELHNRSVEEDLINEFLKLINDCEFERYAPTQDDHAKEKYFDETVKVISSFEESIK